jgi:hypothetical protein
LHVATAFPRVTLFGGIAQEILHRPEHERTESSAIGIGTLKELTFKHPNEEILGQVLCIGDGLALVADEGEHRPPINFAKVRERLARLLLAAFQIPAGKNDAPPRRHEAVTALTGSRRI